MSSSKQLIDQIVNDNLDVEGPRYRAGKNGTMSTFADAKLKLDDRPIILKTHGDVFFVPTKQDNDYGSSVSMGVELTSLDDKVLELILDNMKQNCPFGDNYELKQPGAGDGKYFLKIPCKANFSEFKCDITPTIKPNKPSHSRITTGSTVTLELLLKGWYRKDDTGKKTVCQYGISLTPQKITFPEAKPKVVKRKKVDEDDEVYIL